MSYSFGISPTCVNSSYNVFASNNVQQAKNNMGLQINSQLQVDTFVQPKVANVDKKKMPLWQKIGIGVASVLAVAGIGVMIVRGKNSAIKQLAEHIEFKKAKSIEDAAEFAKKNFGVKNFDVKDLQIANYVNEGLTRASNKVKGKNIAMPHSIRVEKMKEGIQASYTNPLTLSRELTINPDVFSPESVTKMFSEIVPLQINGVVHKLPQKEFIEKYWNKADFLTRVQWATATTNEELLAKRGPFHFLYHELGHLNHKVQNPKLYKQFRSGTGLDIVKKGSSKASEEHMKLLTDAGILQLCLDNFGGYCILYPHEFVAEMYAYMMQGYKLPTKVMEIYKKYGGPTLKI